MAYVALHISVSSRHGLPVFASDAAVQPHLSRCGAPTGSVPLHMPFLESTPFFHLQPDGCSLTLA